MFEYPKYINNQKVIAEIEGKNANMLMDITLFLLKKGEKKSIALTDKECAVLLLSGSLKLSWQGEQAIISRKNVFEEEASCLHVPCGVNIEAEALEASEFLIQATINKTSFAPKLYLPKDIILATSCKGKWENTALRNVKTVFDYTVAPYSNMVLGEVIAPQGRWWSYIPHHHPQPEVYYYKFQRAEGFGACFIGEQAYTVKDGSYGAFEGGLNHPQVTAPGYPMYCCWMIRHLPDNPWTDRIDDKRYTWLLDI